MVDGFSNATSRDDMAFSTPGGFMFKMDNNNNGISSVQGFNVYNRTNESVFSIEETNGNVGIGTDTPEHNLHVQLNTNTKFKTYTYGAETVVNKTGGWARAFRVRNENDDVTTSFGAHGGDAYISTGFDGISDPAGFQNKKLIVKTNGNIGIGTNDPGDWKLAVNGNIRAKEIKVETGWSDFVFESDYNLPTLKEVEEHINEKGHLKDIPSAADVAKDGINLGEMNSKLLQKIEELTLYTIAQEKRILQMEERLNKLEK